MSEILDQPTSDKSEQFDEQAERKRLMDQYRELDRTRLNCEQDGRIIYEVLRKSLHTDTELTEVDQSKINKMKSFFELDESTLSGVEEAMAEMERTLGYSPEDSSRFDNYEDDLLVNSAVFYHERIDSLREATSNSEIDKAFIDAVIQYAHAVEHDENSTMSQRFDDIKDKQAYMENCQRRRSNCHNDMINKFDKLNDLAREHNLKPLTYRNLIMNSSANGFRNNAQMYHDRVTLARYVRGVIQLGFDRRLPDPKYLKET